MTSKNYTDEQWKSIFKENESGTPVPKLLEKYHISNSTYYKYRTRILDSDNQPVFCEVTISDGEGDVIQDEAITISKHGFVFEFRKSTDIALFRTLVGILNDY